MIAHVTCHTFCSRYAYACNVILLRSYVILAPKIPNAVQSAISATAALRVHARKIVQFESAKM